MDAFVLRFPGTGIVNVTRNVLDRLRHDARCDVTILLQDLDFSDPQLAEFAKSLRHRLVERSAIDNFILKLRRGTTDRELSVDLPLPGMIHRNTKRADVYHCTDWYYYPSRHARKNIITIYDLTTTLFPQFHERTNIVKECRKAKQLPKFDTIVAISECTKRDLIQHYRLPDDKIIVIPLGAAAVYESPGIIGRAELESFHQLPPGRRYLLSVSAIEPRKNIIGLLKAFDIFITANPDDDDVVLVLVGPTGWKGDELAEYMKNYPHRERVIFTGYVPLTDMPSLYRHAECFLYLSFYEGFGLPILEAMMSSCPVICSNISSMPEVIGDCGQLVSPHKPEEAAAAIARLLGSETLAENQRQRGLARSKLFSWDKFVDRLVEVYNA